MWLVLFKPKIYTIYALAKWFALNNTDIYVYIYIYYS